jgi:hypothetical protein
MASGKNMFKRYKMCALKNWGEDQRIFAAVQKKEMRVELRDFTPTKNGKTKRTKR